MVVDKASPRAARALVALLRRALREPLVHFVLLGAALFAADAHLRRPPRNQITVSAAYIDGLRDEHRARAGRDPTPDELRGQIERYIDEEVLEREASALGLAQGDLIVRRRLAQKMQFLLEDEASIKYPSPTEIDEYIKSHKDRYRAPQVISFRHIFVSRDRHGQNTTADAEHLLTEIHNGADPGALGDPFVQGSAFAKRTEKDIEAVFGAAFTKTITIAHEGIWQGPIESSYGAHLVLVTERVDEPSAITDALRAHARDDLRAEKREESLKAAMIRLRSRYQITVESWDGQP